MVLFRSQEPDVPIPTNVTVWECLFESEQYFARHESDVISSKGFVNADTRERIRYPDLKIKAAALSTCWQRDHGLKPGDTVSVLCGNTPWYPVCMFACYRSGARINGMSALFTVDEITYSLRTAKSKIVVAAKAILDRVLEAASQIGIPHSNVFAIDEEVDGINNLAQVIERGSSMSQIPYYRLPQGSTNKDVCANLNFSSGTTGLPKAVMLSHHNMLAHVHHQRQVLINTPHTPLLAIIPLYHITGTWRFGILPIFLNIDCVMMPSFTMEGMLKAIVDFRIEELNLVPPLVLRLAHDPVVEQYDLSHVKRATCAAAPLAAEVLQSMKVRFPQLKFRNAYGATEGALIACSMDSSLSYDAPKSVGMLVSNTSAKVVDPSGRELGPNQVGEIVAKGPQVAMCYLDNEKSTRETFLENGFYRTGDAGYFDEKGLLYITDRLKEMIKVKATQVAPAELEDLLLGHELVADCAVIGQADDYAGEVPKAFVVLKGCDPSYEAGQQILKYVQQKKTRVKWLAEVEFVDAIPKSAAGKLLRRQLRQREQEREQNLDINDRTLRVRDTQRFGRQYRAKSISFPSAQAACSKETCDKEVEARLMLPNSKWLNILGVGVLTLAVFWSFREPSVTLKAKT